MKKLKVLQIIPSFETGGAEKVVLDYLLNQHKANIIMKAVSLYNLQDTMYGEIAKANGIEIIYLNKKRGVDLRIIYELYKVIKDYQPDVVHSHLYSLKYSFIPTIFLRVKGKFHTIHSRPEKDSSGISKMINKFIFKYSNYKPIVLHENMKMAADSYYGINTSIVLENGIDFAPFEKNTETQYELRRRLGLPVDAWIIGHVGSFKPVKNHKFIIKVFEKTLKEKNKNQLLLLVGDGPLKSEIEEDVEKMGLSDQVIFLGVREDIPQILKAMDVFIFPSIYEGFPIALIEAQAARLKVVASRNIDNSVILSSNAVQLELDSIDDWCSEVFEENKKDRESIKKIDKFSLHKVMPQLENVYRSHSS